VSRGKKLFEKFSRKRLFSKVNEKMIFYPRRKKLYNKSTSKRGQKPKCNPPSGSKLDDVTSTEI